MDKNVVFNCVVFNCIVLYDNADYYNIDNIANYIIVIKIKIRYGKRHVR